VADYRFVIVDVFTDRPLAGNQLAVFTDARSLPVDLLQPVARELNFSETVFVFPPEGDGHVRIRIFTPDRELPFAGHPLLGTAFALAGPLQLASIQLETKAGVVPVELEREGARIVFGRMAQPLPSVEPVPFEAELLAALGVARSTLPVELYDLGPRHAFAVLEHEDELGRIEPDAAALKRLPPLCAACVAGSGRRWRARVFCPSYAVSEDPATGSAAGPLAYHLARHGRIAFGDEIEIRQGVEIRRPSVLHARALGSVERLEKIEVGGSAVVVARGEFRF
jgi:trans-2,3-dihydro-3-hydroxyanthranilate isomerase